MRTVNVGYLRFIASSSNKTLRGFKGVSSKQRIKRQSKSFLKNTLSQKPPKLVDYIEHLTDIEMRKDQRRTENDRKCVERKQQEYNEIDWEDLYHRNHASCHALG